MVPTVAGASRPEIESDSVLKATRDRFHKGAFEVYQPSGSGHRSGLDALLLAAALPEGASGLLADLGAGAGVAGFAALNLNRDLDLLGVEKNSKMIELARRSLRLVANSKLRSRVSFLEADVTVSGRERDQVGLTANRVDHVIMNPPYNGSTERAPPDSLKMEAHMLGAEGIDCWFRTAAALTKPGGTLSLIYRTANLGEVLACCQGRFGGLEILPVYSRADEASKRLVIRGTRASRAPMAIVPGIIIHERDGQFTTQARAIFDASARLAFAG